jgi:hemolysin III
MKRSKRPYTHNEEIANAATHFVGILLGAMAGVWLLKKALYGGDLWAVCSLSVYIVCMLFSYITSTYYHTCKEGRRKMTLRKLDHVAIYFHIAGTYTFFTLTVLRNTAYWGWTLFIIVWVAALIGTYISYKGKGLGNRIETVCYVVMGLVVFVAFKPLIETLRSTDSLDVLWYVIAGGASFIVGALFYSFKKVKYIHAVFHLFVLGGSIFHILAIASTLSNQA